MEQFRLLFIIATMARAVGLLLRVGSPKLEVFEIHSLTVHQKFVLFIAKCFSIS